MCFVRRNGAALSTANCPFSRSTSFGLSSTSADHDECARLRSRSPRTSGERSTGHLVVARRGEQPGDGGAYLPASITMTSSYALRQCERGHMSATQFTGGSRNSLSSSFTRPLAALGSASAARRAAASCAAPTVHTIRVSPPLAITHSETDWALEQFRRGLGASGSSASASLQRQSHFLTPDRVHGP